MDPAYFRSLAKFRQGARRLRAPETFATLSAELNVRSAHALARCGDTLIDEIKGMQLRTFAAGSYSSITIEPLGETLVTGSAVRGNGVRLARFLADANGRPARHVAAQFRDSVTDAVLLSNPAIIRMNGWDQIRIIGGLLGINRLSSATDTVGVEVTPPGGVSNTTFVARAEEFPYGIRVANAAAGVIPTYWQYAREAQALELTRFDGTTAVPAARPGDYYEQGMDAYDWADGVGNDSAVFSPNPLAELQYSGAFHRDNGPAPWRSLDTELRLKQEAAFVIVVAKLNDDHFDQMCRIECALGVERDYLVVKTIDQLAQVSFSRGPQACRGLQEYVFGFDIWEPITHVRVRNIYPPYLSQGEQPGGHIQVYAMAWESQDLKGVK